MNSKLDIILLAAIAALAVLLAGAWYMSRNTLAPAPATASAVGNVRHGDAPSVPVPDVSERQPRGVRGVNDAPAGARGQSPRIPPRPESLSDTVRAIVGLDPARQDHQSRLAAVHALAGPVSEADREALYAFLATRQGADAPNPAALNALKNDVLIRLIKQQLAPAAELLDVMLEQFHDTTQDRPWRDYIVQHFRYYVETRWPNPDPTNETDNGRDASGGREGRVALPGPIPMSSSDAGATTNVGTAGRVAKRSSSSLADAQEAMPATGFAVVSAAADTTANPIRGGRGDAFPRRGLGGGAPDLQTIVDAYRTALREVDSSIAGTALIGFEQLSRRYPEFDRAEAVAAAQALAADPAATPGVRGTALQVCALVQADAALPLAQELARSGTAGVPLRMAAIATVGDLGNRRDVAFLETLLSSTDRRLHTAAAAAIDRINRREAL